MKKYGKGLAILCRMTACKIEIYQRKCVIDSYPIKQKIFTDAGKGEILFATILLLHENFYSWKGNKQVLHYIRSEGNASFLSHFIKRSEFMRELQKFSVDHPREDTGYQNSGLLLKMSSSLGGQQSLWQSKPSRVHLG